MTVDKTQESIEATIRPMAAALTFHCWAIYQLGAGQHFNGIPRKDQLESQEDGLKFFLANPNATPEENHENWMKFRLADGWKYGPVKDETKKEHPDLVPYKDLLTVERLKDTMDLESRKVVVSVLNQIFQLGQLVAQERAASIATTYVDALKQGVKLDISIHERIMATQRSNALEFTND